VHLTSTLLHAALPWLSPRAQALIDLMVMQRGHLGSAVRLALAVELKTRWQLARLLSREGLPCLEELAAWIRILVWVVESETTGMALSRYALNAERDPSPCYRTIGRLTGLSWKRVRNLGSDYVLLALIERCRRPGEPRRPRARLPERRRRGDALQSDEVSGAATARLLAPDPEADLDVLEGR
jgi:hypothetical protein